MCDSPFALCCTTTQRRFDGAMLERQVARTRVPCAERSAAAGRGGEAASVGLAPTRCRRAVERAANSAELALRFLELEGAVQHSYCELEVLLVDDDRDLDFRRRDHLDVDVLFGERLEHAR